MKKILFAAALAAGCGLFADGYLDVDITGIRQRYPWNGKVDIDFTVAATDATRPVVLTFTATDATADPAAPLLAQTFDGAATNVFAVLPGTYRTTWDTDKDLPQSVIDKVSFKISASTDYPDTETKRYMIVDLRKGTSATASDRYPVQFLPCMPLGMAAGADKTDFLVLRRIPATTSDEWKALSDGKDYFVMGPTEDDDKSPNKDTPPQKVRITKDFYIGVYEFTQRQYELITGTRPSYFSNDDDYATRPVENVLGNSQVGGTRDGQFMKTFRDRTGYAFRLPSEAEWEYAARAGTRTVWHNGGSFTGDGWGDENLQVLGRYSYNNGNNGGTDSYTPDLPATTATAKVGSYQPNAWGLYDMHGNVSEMCRDYWADDMVSRWKGQDESTGIWTDPGFLSYDNVDYQAKRGGHFHERAEFNLLTRRRSYLGYGDSANKETGFRIACPAED